MSTQASRCPPGTGPCRASARLQRRGWARQDRGDRGVRRPVSPDVGRADLAPRRVRRATWLSGASSQGQASQTSPATRPTQKATIWPKPSASSSPAATAGSSPAIALLRRGYTPELAEKPRNRPQQEPGPPCTPTRYRPAGARPRRRHQRGSSAAPDWGFYDRHGTQLCVTDLKDLQSQVGSLPGNRTDAAAADPGDGRRPRAVPPRRGGGHQTRIADAEPICTPQHVRPMHNKAPRIGDLGG